MAGTVTSNLVLYNNADSATGWTNTGTAPNPGLALDNDVFVQGTGAMSWGLKSTGTSSIWAPTATVNLRNNHLYMWLRNDALNRCNNQNAGGTSIVIGTSTANYGVWYLAGPDTWDGAWRCFAFDCNALPDERAGTWLDVNLTASAFIGWQFRVNTATAKAVPTTWADVIYSGGGSIYVYGGTPASPATFEDMYSASNAVGNKWGIFNKNEGVYIPRGYVSIGSGSANTYFQDQSQIVVFSSDWVSQSLYQFVITGSSTTCSFGTPIGTGTDTLGVNTVTIKGAGNWYRTFGNRGIGNFTASLKPPFKIDKNVYKLSLYGCILDSIGNISFGDTLTTMTGSKLVLVDNQFSTTLPIYKNLLGDFSQSLRNKAVTTSGSSVANFSGSGLTGTGDYNDRVGFAIKLVDTASIDGDSFTVLNSYGFTSISSSNTQSLSITNHPFSSNTQYLAVYRNKTWDIINPIWNTPTTRSLFFVDPIGSRVNELYSYDTTVVDNTGTPISTASVFIFQGLQGRTIPNSGSTNNSGIFSNNLLTNIWTKGSGSASPLTQSAYGNFASRVYKYTYTPFIGILASSQSIVASVALTPDSNITEFTASTAISAGTGIGVYYHSPTPAVAIGYNSGSTALVSGSRVTGSTSGAAGQVVEYLGSTDNGVVFMRNRNGVQFTNKEALLVGGVAYASSSVSASLGGFLGNYTYEYDCNLYDLYKVYDYNYAKLAQLPLDTSSLANYQRVHTWGGTAEKSPIYLGGSGYYTVRNTSLGQGWWLSKRGVGAVAYMTDDTGSLYIPPAQYTLALSGLITGSEVWIFQSGSGAPGSLGTTLASTPSSSGNFSYTYTYVTDFYTNIVVNSLNYENILLPKVLATNADLSIPIQQRIDRNYSNPAGP